MTLARPVAMTGLVALLLAFALAGCGGPASQPSATPAAAIPSDAASADPTAADPGADVLPASPVVGIVVAIETAALGEVAAFTLRLPGGELVDFRIEEPLENAAEFPLAHLGEHRAVAAPVRVFFVPGPEGPIVTRLEDAE